MNAEERPGRPSNCDLPGWNAYGNGHGDCDRSAAACPSMSALLLAYAGLVARSGPRTHRPARWFATLAIGIYRHTLTRWTPACPQAISCSAFAVQVIRECGPVTGAKLAAYRVAHCEPPRAEGLPKEAPGCNR
jgi:putative component of membrane protein insertase Oxa1/YidC/SpoIIIJ protein YidD